MISFIESLTQIPAQINCIEFSNHSRPFIYDYYNDLAMAIQTTLTRHPLHYNYFPYYNRF